MSHGITTNDNMFSVGETPWHKLGKVLDAPPTIAEALQLAGLDWDVALLPCYTDVPAVDEAGNWTHERVKLDRYSVMRSDSRAVIGNVGSKYAPVQNRDALGWFDPWLKTGKVQLETAGTLFGGRKIWALAKIVSDPIDVGGGDTVNKYILLGHAHDGSMAIYAGTTAVRVVCNNTLGLALNGGGLIRIQHTSGAMKRLEDAAEQIERIDARLSAAGEAYKFLAKRPVTGKDRVTEYVAKVYYKGDMEKAKKGNRVDHIAEIFEDSSVPGQDTASAKGTYWGLMNALTYYETHGNNKNKDERHNMESRANRNGFGNSGAKRMEHALQVAVAMGKSISIDDVFGDFSDVGSLADASHPDAALA